MADNDATDLSEYKSAHGAAKAAGRKIEEIAETLDQDPDLEVTVEKRDGRFGEHWVVSWPGGPYNWATTLTRGENLFVGEMPRLRKGENNPQITGFFGSDGFDIECENGTTLAFYSR